MDEYEMAGWQPVDLLDQRCDDPERYRDRPAADADERDSESSAPPGSRWFE